MLPIAFWRSDEAAVGVASWSGKNSDSEIQSLDSSSLLVKGGMWVKYLTSLCSLVSFICKKRIWLNRIILVKCLVQRPEQTKFWAWAIMIDYHHLWPQAAGPWRTEAMLVLREEGLVWEQTQHRLPGYQLFRPRLKAWPWSRERKVLSGGGPDRDLVKGWNHLGQRPPYSGPSGVTSYFHAPSR